jgi:hypothetical protein
MRRSLVCAGSILAALACLAAATAAHAQPVWGTSTAELSTDPGFEGLWKYCFDINWNTNLWGAQGLSHADVFLGLEDCATACDPGRFAFADTVGSGGGEGGCTVYYQGEFLCDGEPHFPQFPYPTVKFEYYSGDCEPGAANSAHVCFYSVFVPAPPAVHPDALGIKFGLNTGTGPLEGPLPMCEVSPVDETTWGTIKHLYRPSD